MFPPAPGTFRWEYATFGQYCEPMDLILSDLHSNLQALRTVLRYAKRRSFERYVLLGDLVGYGANPNETLDLVRQLEPATLVRGNHDRACITPGLDLSFSLPARSAVTWTKGRLTEEHAWFLEGLPTGPQSVGQDYQIVHGSPLDEDAYLLHPREALLAFDGFASNLCFFGHTHLPGGYELDDQEQRLTMLTFTAGEWFPLRDGCKYLINPGSVGQPRDRDPRLSFMIYDPGHRRLRLHRLEYDHAGAARAILNAGLHPNLAERLQHGI
jgi:predicted phosphodiesterase